MYRKQRLSCPAGGIGRHAGLKIRSLRACGFNSRAGYHAAIAQLVERLVEGQGVAGSTPARCTISLYNARMVKLVDTKALSPFAKALAGSSPAAGTILLRLR